jgi:hypothetical protein
MKVVYGGLYRYKVNAPAVPFETGVFGKDTLLNWNKSGVIWYTKDNFLSFQSTFTREGDSVPF